MDKHQDLLFKANQSVQSKWKNAQKSYWAMQYHVIPPAYWMNDPNGFSYYNDEYHLFYQHHPYSPKWGPMHWGHVKSKDLVFWKHEPIALAPSEEYDKDGCFSGSAIEKDGKLYLLYTGHIWTGKNPDTDLKQVQCLAVSEDGIRFKKIKENPVIRKVPDERNIHPNHFRDPKVWKRDDWYYCVIGSRSVDNKGQALLYRSKDLVRWEFLNILAKGEGNQGTMWECPDFFHLDGHDVLVISPQGIIPEDNKYQNLHQSGYMIGNMDYETNTFHKGDFQLFDYGFDFYAAQTMLDREGRRIMIGWMNMWESDMPEQVDNWAGAMTIPRLLTINSGQLLCKPIPELKKLRTEEIALEGVWIDGERSFMGVEGDSFELILTVDLHKAKQFGIKLRANKGHSEETVISYDKREGYLTIDRNKSGKGPGGIRKAPVDLIEGKLHLQIFSDRSSLEIFINHGKTVMTARIYPGPESTGIRFFTDGKEKAEIVRLKKWNLRKSVIFSGS